MPRPRLVLRLATGLSGPLTLISAPPGSGKTTLLSEWRADAGSDAALAWLSLDADDNDPVRFLEGLIAALGAVRQGLGVSAASMLAAGQPLPPTAILAALANDLAAAGSDLPQGVVLVLDDYHVITAPPIHDALAFLLAHLPRTVHLALLTREDPPLPLSRLRVRGELTEIRERDLQFTADEVAAFLTQTMGVQLSDAGIAGLVKLMQVLRHGRVPPLALFGSLNSHVELDDGLFEVPLAERAWDGPVPRIGAVSSFGFSGTNVHAVLQEPPAPSPARGWHRARSPPWHRTVG